MYRILVLVWMYLRCSLFCTIYSIFSCTLSFYNDIWLILCMYVSINKCNYLIELRQRHISKLIQAPTCIYLLLASIWVCIMWLKCVLYIVYSSQRARVTTSAAYARWDFHDTIFLRLSIFYYNNKSYYFLSFGILLHP